MLFRSKVYALVLRMTGSREEAEEILQDTFLKLHRNADRFRPALGSPRAFIFTIARNQALSYLRARRSRPSKAAWIDLHESNDQRFSLPAIDVSDRILVESLLGTLDQEEKKLLTEAFYGGYSHSELSHRSGLSLGTVKSKLRRALAKLRNRLEAR